MTTFLLFIFGLWGSRYFFKYLFGTHQVDSVSRTARQNNCSNIDRRNSNTSSSVGKAVPFVLGESNKTHSLKTIDKTKPIVRKVPRYYNDFGNSVEYVSAPELNLLKLSPFQTTIKLGETIQFKLTRFDSFDNQIEIKDRISWSATAGEIDSKGLFLIDSIDKALVTITAKVNEIEATAKVNIENIYELLEPPKLKSLEVVPDCISLQPNEEHVFKAIGLDRYNNPIDCSEIIWSATGGTIDRNGKLLAGNNSKGIYQVTATSKHTPKHNAVAKTTLLTLGVSTRILSWAVANEEFFYDVLVPLLNLTNDDDSLSEIDALVQGWIFEIGRRRVAKLLKKASNLSFKEAFSNISDSIDYIVVPELRKIEFVNPPSNVKPGDRIQFNVIGLDQAGDRLDVQDEIIWTTTSGKIDSQGLFIAGNSANSVEVVAKVKNNNFEAKIKLRIEANLEENYYETASNNACASSNLLNLSKQVASKIGKTKEYLASSKKQEVISKFKRYSDSGTDDTKKKQANNHTSAIRKEQKTKRPTKNSTIKFQSNCASSNTNSSDTDSKSSSTNHKTATFTNKSNGLAIYSPRFLIQAGQTKKFQIITGFNSPGCPIKYQGEPVIWETTAGKINSEGVLKTPIAFKDQYIEVSAKVNDAILYYSFHTTGTHEYVVFNEYGYLPHISEQIDELICESFDLMDEYYELIIERLKIFEVDTSSKKELFEDIIDYLVSHQNLREKMMLDNIEY